MLLGDLIFIEVLYVSSECIESILQLSHLISHMLIYPLSELSCCITHKQLKLGHQLVHLRGLHHLLHLTP